MKLNLEQKIKDFVHGQGVNLVGLAGPDRLDGPPSLDPAYTLKGAKSIVSMVLPMDQGAIYDYLGKRSAVPHNVDQLKGNQHMFRVSEMVAGYIRSLGHRAAVVPPNNSYRRTLYVFATGNTDEDEGHTGICEADYVGRRLRRPVQDDPALCGLLDEG